MSKLALGTAQFGMAYGISNTAGYISDAYIREILKVASESLIDLIDTASQYGSSEERLAEQLDDKSKFRIITKIPYLLNNFQGMGDIFNKSLKKLKRIQLYGLLFHDASALLASEKTKNYKFLQSIKDKGLVEKIGVSLYHPTQAFHILNQFKLDIVQIPLNVLDQRFLKTGCLSFLKERGVEVHVRSVFLQGLLLMDPSQLSPYFSDLVPHLKYYFSLLDQLSLTKHQAAIDFIKLVAEIDYVVVGVQNHRELNDIITSWRSLDQPQFNYDDYAINDERYLIPSHWK